MTCTYTCVCVLYSVILWVANIAETSTHAQAVDTRPFPPTKGPGDEATLYDECSD